MKQTRPHDLHCIVIISTVIINFVYLLSKNNGFGKMIKVFLINNYSECHDDLFLCVFVGQTWKIWHFFNVAVTLQVSQNLMASL